MPLGSPARKFAVSFPRPLDINKLAECKRVMGTLSTRKGTTLCSSVCTETVGEGNGLWVQSVGLTGLLLATQCQRTLDHQNNYQTRCCCTHRSFRVKYGEILKNLEKSFSLLLHLKERHLQPALHRCISHQEVWRRIKELEPGDEPLHMSPWAHKLRVSTCGLKELHIFNPAVNVPQRRAVSFTATFLLLCSPKKHSLQDKRAAALAYAGTRSDMKRIAARGCASTR